MSTLTLPTKPATIRLSMARAGDYDITAWLWHANRQARGMALTFQAASRGFPGVFVWALGECTAVISDKGIEYTRA